MNSYLSGTVVKLPISFTDNDGNELQVTAAQYKIIDQNGETIKELDSFDVTEAELTIDAIYNTLQPLNLDSITVDSMHSVQIDHLRILEFQLVLDDGNTIPFDLVYLIKPRERLITGLNSFQTLNQAKLTALSIPLTEMFLEESNDMIVSAMIEAKSRICSLSLTDYNLQEIPPTKFNELPEQLKSALRKAQVAEANVIIGGGDPVEVAMSKGLKSQTIGETHETYIGGKQINSAISNAALRYLGGYVTLNKKLVRA